MSATPGGPPAVQTVVAGAPAGTPVWNQVTVTTTATAIRPAVNANRAALVVVNHGSTNVFLGFSNAVTPTTGVLLVGVPGSSLTFQTQTVVYGIVATGSQIVSFYEEVR
jgi:hypothetical protein